MGIIISLKSVTLFCLVEITLDTLIIKALNVSTKIGVYEWEQRINQQLLIDISIDTDFSACQEDLTKTIDYEALCSSVTLYVESKSFQLIETVANEVADLIKKQFKVSQITVGISKPHAIKNTANIQVVARR
ncbi:dihydroneopterin aldolase [Legionella parisiensis]|uniref:7,8-dihydroneopterin aldolase n=1 Tax=Legionella parisiensis TaxID=45071 RepID=A0A1E5JTF4_9GAMM|nr:dihydroneopterin aldolase [Legionella parisiensis]OEH47806.1 Dihydroneopterin aldolase [Legionella parisiensis]STX77169.1 dihydroneopterin aldolase [Legionella parisiensis]